MFDQHCARCHLAGGAKASAETLAHLSMGSYPFASHHGNVTQLIRSTLGMLGGEAEMPADAPGTLRPDELALIAAWADAADRARPPAPDAASHGDDHGAGHDHTLMPPYATPREMLIPGRPGPRWHIMVNAFAQLQNLGLAGTQIDSGAGRFDGGETDALLTGTWVMGYYRSPRRWVEAVLMLNFEALSVSDGGTPELGQEGEGLIDAQHSHLLLHMAMVGFHPLASSACNLLAIQHDDEPCHDLTIFAGQGSATIGPPVFMHRASAPGPTVPRKHHKGENPHETMPVLGATFRYHGTSVEASVFGNRRLGPDDSRLRPWPAVPRSLAARVRQDLFGWLELQLSAAHLVAQGPDGEEDDQLSASAYGYRTVRGWRGDALLDYAYSAHAGLHGALAELAVRPPGGRQILWTRGEVNQREADAEGTTWAFATAGFEQLVAAPRGLRIGLFAEATAMHIPDAARYGRDSAVTLNAGLHLFGMWGGHSPRGDHATTGGGAEHH